ncbi:hypothetical protein B0H16DRAFT_1452806 [Mycena metata]|uniref:Uncharacterized protein n=1 Tax=Mycena metata TaxID=1033252 RepID=A0AAD7JPB2_9AGAR|nr:hypothetical protein B0H16DRAFT_1452806 [Mycena metata]
MIWGRSNLSFPLQRENTQFVVFCQQGRARALYTMQDAWKRFRCWTPSWRLNRPLIHITHPALPEAVCFDNSFSGNRHFRSIIADLALIFQEPTYATGAAVPGSVNNRRNPIYPYSCFNAPTRRAARVAPPTVDYFPVVVPMPSDINSHYKNNQRPIKRIVLQDKVSASFRQTEDEFQ